MERRIFFKSGVLERFRKCHPGATVKGHLRDELTTLKTNPHKGYPVPFSNPIFYQLRIETAEGTYWVNYTFDEKETSLLYVGIPGVC
jgi:hypothetical protein